MDLSLSAIEGWILFFALSFAARPHLAVGVSSIVVMMLMHGEATKEADKHKTQKFSMQFRK